MADRPLSTADLFELGKYLAMLAVVVLSATAWFALVNPGGFEPALGIGGGGGTDSDGPLAEQTFNKYADAPVATGRESGIDLEYAERVTLAELRDDNAIPEAKRTDAMDAFAAYSLRYYISNGGWYTNATQRRAAQYYGTACTPGIAMTSYVGTNQPAIDYVRSSRRLGVRLANYLQRYPESSEGLARTRGPVGIAIGVTDIGDVYVAVSYC